MVGAFHKVHSDSNWSRQLSQEETQRRIKEFLYEEGPHTVEQLSERFNMKRGRIQEQLMKMKDLGIVTNMRYPTNERSSATNLRRKNRTYWILSDDA